MLQRKRVPTAGLAVCVQESQPVSLCVVDTERRKLYADGQSCQHAAGVHEGAGVGVPLRRAISSFAATQSFNCSACYHIQTRQQKIGFPYSMEFQ
jgi:hypothetical protein